jgi:C-terminal processing protease CtpA/Prc
MAQPQDSGVGIFLAPNRSGQFIVTRVTPGGTAHRSGKVHIGDILLAVNGSGLEGIPVDTVRGMIVGPQVRVRACVLLLVPGCAARPPRTP